MALHRLTSVTMGVPNVSETADYYAEFGLTPAGDGWMSVASRIVQQAAPRPTFNGPGRVERANQRARGFLRTNHVRPRKLGHAVIGSTDYQATMRFFLDGIGFRLSDLIKGEGAFMRCSTDHHNLL